MINGRFGINEHAYDFVLGTDCVTHMVQQLVQYTGKDILLIADEIPLALHGDQLIENIAKLANINVLTIVAKETDKTLHTVNNLLEQAVKLKVTRKTCVVSFGGGLTANVAGVVAGLLFRGVRLVHLPTTFLCASDGILSQKQAVNGSSAKNQFGLYHKPEAFLCDIQWLLTTSKKELAAGMVELAKNALAFDAQLFLELEKMEIGEIDADQVFTFIKLAMDSKNKLMENDPFERKKALALEYGHTVGHALEISQPNIPHGHAVALGARVAAQISKQRGLMSKSQVERHNALIDKMGGMTVPVAPVDLRVLDSILKKDNKRGYVHCKSDEVAMILLKNLSEIYADEELPLTRVCLSEIYQAIANLGWQTSASTQPQEMARHIAH